MVHKRHNDITHSKNYKLKPQKNEDLKTNVVGFDKTVPMPLE